ncbi:hypothetical protein H2199_001176 [Coniosporium tulheliwenetii]|uniref:Uncharacterized protein n=1 Tax=Coniosporium tulheliwenetii TaxID=3383036 RepID=A0ACC2ZL88_9PEZI|nr:hypothetical protein H2199_001176 [Cladosporium sp. JES 115]
MDPNPDWSPSFDLNEGFMDSTYDWSPFLDMHEAVLQTTPWRSPFASASGTQPTHASSELQQGNLAPDCGSSGVGTPQSFDQAIQTALASLDEEANPPNKHICFVPGCKKNQFTRGADLQRHIKTVHVRDEAFYCEVKGCRRHEHAIGGQRPFPRKDKMMEHMRTVHKNLRY